MLHSSRIRPQNESISFEFDLNEEKNSTVKYALPLAYLYEPNSAILKSGAFNIVGEKTGVFKLHQHTHLYTSESLVNFPGRHFKIDNVIPYNSKTIKKLFACYFKLTAIVYVLNILYFKILFKKIHISKHRRLNKEVMERYIAIAIVTPIQSPFFHYHYRLLFEATVDSQKILLNYKNIVIKNLH